MGFMPPPRRSSAAMSSDKRYAVEVVKALESIGVDTDEALAVVNENARFVRDLHGRGFAAAYAAQAVKIKAGIR
jgi:hypothetical protein